MGGDPRDRPPPPIAQAEPGRDPFQRRGIIGGPGEPLTAPPERRRERIAPGFVEGGGPDDHRSLREGAAVGGAEARDRRDVDLQPSQGQPRQADVQAEQGAARVPPLSRPGHFAWHAPLGEGSAGTPSPEAEVVPPGDVLQASVRHPRAERDARRFVRTLPGVTPCRLRARSPRRRRSP